jgi:hypothetical protein
LIEDQIKQWIWHVLIIKKRVVSVLIYIDTVYFMAAILDYGLCWTHICFDYKMWMLIYMYINTIYLSICKVSQFLQILFNCLAIFLFKHNFVMSILDFGGHIGFYLSMIHFWLKIDKDMYYNVKCQDCYTISNSNIVKNLIFLYFMANAYDFMAVILDLSGHLGFLSLRMNALSINIINCNKYTYFHRIHTIHKS